MDIKKFKYVIKSTYTKEMDNICESFEKKFKNFTDSVFNENAIRIEIIIMKDEDKIKPDLWKEIRENYELRKSKLNEKLKSLDYLL